MADDGNTTMDDATHTTYLLLAQGADQNRRQALVMKLERERGIAHAVFDANDPTRLRVDYDTACFSELTLLDIVHRHGWAAELQDR